MSTPSARHHFLAWARRGIGSCLDNPDYGGSLPLRGTLNVALSITAQGATPTVRETKPVPVQLYGPGDLTRIDLRQTVRTEPADGTLNFEPNYLAAIEFDEPDFPWLFTPAAPAGNRLRPWHALIVLKPGEYTPVQGTAFPAVDVSTLAALQPLDDAWNWAHTQLSGDDGLANTLASTPASVISRIICPRRLDPETGYLACLVPAFEGGRLAGLGQDVSVISSEPAWTANTAVPLRLPVYYQFKFSTTDAGDFESLVRRLVPRQLGNNIGQRPMSVDAPEENFPGAGTPLGLQGALQSLAVAPTPWLDPAKTAFQSALQDFVNRTTAVKVDPANPGPDPTVVPPIYGRWHAGIATVDRTMAGWLNELNLDPRNRTSSGMGTQVIQSKLTSLLASAWQQVAGIEQANAKLRAAQLARATLTAVHANRFAAASNAHLLTLTAPLHARVMASPQTVRATVAASRVPVRLFSPAFRRLTSKAGPIRRRQASAGMAPGNLVERVNANEISIVPPPQLPGGLVPIEHLPGSNGSDHPQWLNAFPIELDITTAQKQFSVIIDVKSHGATSLDAVRLAQLTPDAIRAIPARGGFTISAAGVTPPAGNPGSSDSPDAAAFRNALLPLAAVLQAARPDPPLAEALDLQALHDTLLARLDPVATVPNRVLSTLKLDAALHWTPPDPIQPIMAAPSYPQPMYVPLRDLSSQYILPGLDQIPPDTVALLESNHAFIEAYMVGLNHEMARQLLWAGYPTDLRGSYFRQFWDVSQYVAQAGDPTDPTQLAELLKDIPMIHTWPLGGPLGAHENRTGPPDDVVLIVCGELLRRYPDAVIYAAKAQVVDGHRVIDPSDERYPIFRGTLPNDVTFIGFNLSPAEAKGQTEGAPEGFFFVFQQHPTGPRFGLEPLAQNGVTAAWASLAWTDFAAVGPAPRVETHGARAAPGLSPNLFSPPAPWRLASQVFSSVLANYALPPFLSASNSPQGIAITAAEDQSNQWGSDAAQTASILLRLPFRIAIHADQMIPFPS
jgi:hypothetical protein